MRYSNVSKSMILPLLTLLCGVVMFSSCAGDVVFSTEKSHVLSFSADTIALDTTFSNVPTATKTFWVYNYSGSNLKCSEVRLEKGNQTGFRVNVDGIYLGPTNGYRTKEVEIRKNDSIRVFVELTSSQTFNIDPVKLEDNLAFTLESGVKQKINLNAYSWDADKYDDLHITTDKTLFSLKPIVIYGGITVDSGATLRLMGGTTLYFHNDAGMKVYGNLVSEGKPNANVVLRGDRIDRMFDYLPYDNVSGQWQGIRLMSSSYGNSLAYTDIHSAYNGVMIDSSDVNRMKLNMAESTIHNCQGYGIYSNNAKLFISNSQITNTLDDCISIDGGVVRINNCTIAQFYPFDSERGEAMYLSARKNTLVNFSCINSLVTGYADNVLKYAKDDENHDLNFEFENCIIRTPQIEGEDKSRFCEVIFEDPKDTVTTGVKHFKRIDTENLRYDFQLDSMSPAIDRANPGTSAPNDRNGMPRNDKPDIGAYEYLKTRDK